MNSASSAPTVAATKPRWSASDRLGETAEGGIGKADLVGADQAVVGEKQRRQQDLAVAQQLDAAEAAENLRPQCGRPARDHHHVLAPGVQVDAPDFQLRTWCADRGHAVVAVAEAASEYAGGLPASY